MGVGVLTTWPATAATTVPALVLLLLLCTCRAITRCSPNAKCPA